MLCSRGKHIVAVLKGIESLPLTQLQRTNIDLRYSSILHSIHKRVRRYSYSFHILRILITVGSLIVPALLSVQYTDGSKISSDGKEVYWVVWVLSLLVTISNGIMTLLKIDRKYYQIHTVYQLLLSEGWQFIHLSGNYGGKKTPGIVPTHENQYTFFCHSLEKIIMKQVEEEYYKVIENQQPPATDPLVPLTPFHQQQRFSTRQLNGNRPSQTNSQSSSQTSNTQSQGQLQRIEEAPERGDDDEQDSSQVSVLGNVPQPTSPRGGVL